MATRQLQTPIAARWTSIWRGAGDALEARLEAERERIGLWLPVALGAGIAAWFALPAKAHWIGLLLLLAGGLCGGLLIGWQSRLGRLVVVACGVMAAGVLLIWTRAIWVAAPVLAGPVVTEFSAIVERAEPLPAKGQIRILALPKNRPDSPDPVEPRTLRKIIPPGQARRRRWHQARPDPDCFAVGKRRRLLATQRQPHARRQVGTVLR